MAVLYRWNERVVALTLKLLGNDVKRQAIPLYAHEGGQSDEDFPVL